MSTISASTTSTTAYKVAADTTGTLVFQTGATPTTALTLGSDQSATFAGTQTFSGGTANGVAYLNGSKVLTTGSALSFDSANLTIVGNNTGTDYNNGSLKIGDYAVGGTAITIGNNAASNYSYVQAVKVGNQYNSIVLNPNGGNLGLGVTPSSWGSSFKAVQVNKQATSYATSSAHFTNGLYNDGAWKYNTASDNGLIYQQYTSSGVTFHAWYNATGNNGIGNAPTTISQAMTLDSSGNLLVGTTSTTINGGAFGTVVGGGYIQSSRNVNGTDSACKFFGNAGAAYIQGNGNLLNTNNSYGSLSDAKLKENVVDASPKLAQLNQVRIVNYNLIGDEKKQLGVIAQELEQVFPSMVDESIDRDAEGNDLGTTTKSVKYSVFVPMLIKAIQEQQAIIQAQAADIAALKEKVGI